MTKKLRFGIVGVGGVAALVADAINYSENAEIAAVASRRKTMADTFSADHGIETVFESWAEMLAWKGIDAVYVATPTSVREEICVAAASNKKHVLAEKPFISLESLRKITAACKENKVAFMDGTHFTHYPRTKVMKQTLTSDVGVLQTIRTEIIWVTPSSGPDYSSSVYDTEKEPMGVIGNLAWYSMRAVVEFMTESAVLSTVKVIADKDKQCGTVIRAMGLLEFDNNLRSIFEVGYNAGAATQDLEIIGDKGTISLNDIMFNWSDAAGYLKRTGMNRAEPEFVPTPSETRRAVNMIDHFTGLAKDPTAKEAEASVDISEQTQQLLDALWENIK